MKTRSLIATSLFLGLALLTNPMAVAEVLPATMAFNQANAQNNEMFQRLWGLQVAKDSGSDAGQVGPLASGGMETKKTLLRQDGANRWSFFVDGNGIFSQVGQGGTLAYNINGGGVTTGASYEWNKSISTGFYAGYEGAGLFQKSSTSGLGYQSTYKSALLDNAVRYGLFGTFKQPEGKGFYGMGLVGGTYHQYNYSDTYSSQSSSYFPDPLFPASVSYSNNSSVTGSPGANELDSMLAGGYDMKAGGFTFGPTASLQYTFYAANNARDAVNDSYNTSFTTPYGYLISPGRLATLGYTTQSFSGSTSWQHLSSGYDTSSMLSGLGGHVAYTWTPSKQLLVIPQISLNWQHEFLQNNFSFAEDGYYIGTSRPQILDSLYTGVGVTVEYAKRWNASFFYNASAGNENLVSQNIFLSFGASL